MLVKGDMLGDVVFYGKGAGKLPTASAVVADVVDALKHGSKAVSYTHLMCIRDSQEPDRRQERQRH